MSHIDDIPIAMHPVYVEVEVKHPLMDLSVPPGSVAVHWFEQASYAVKNSAGTVILLDPYFPHDRPQDTFIHDTPPVDEANLIVDAVLLTHSHGDHTCSETIGRIQSSSPLSVFIGPPESMKKIAEEAGAAEERLLVVRAGEERTKGGFTVHAVLSKAPEGDPKEDVPVPDVAHLGFVVEADNVRLYFSGDLMRTFPQRDDLIRPVRDLQPHIGFLTSHPTEEEFPDFPGAALMSERIGLETAVPGHYACFVKRDYDPQSWASHFVKTSVATRITPRNTSFLYSPMDR